MSLFKRKSSSLDPVQKQRKHKQNQYFALIDKCSQIPNDDKIILRKCVIELQQRVISLLEKYRKQSPTNDLKDLQIYLRKYIQKYKIQHPKYPSLKLQRGGQQICLSLQKRRDSLTLSIDVGKTNSKKKTTNQINQNNLNKSIIKQNISNIKWNNKFSTGLSKEQQKNYEQMIHKRKTERLKISKNRVSVTVQNESFLESQLEEKLQQKEEQMNEYKHQYKLGKQYNAGYKGNNSFENMSTNLNLQKKIKENKVNFKQNDFLEAMRFRMKIDQNQQNSNHPSTLKDQSLKQKNLSQLNKSFPNAIQSISSQMKVQNQIRNLKSPNQEIKKRLFQNINQNLQIAFQSKDQFKRQPLNQINSNILQQKNSYKDFLKSSKSQKLTFKQTYPLNYNQGIYAQNTIQSQLYTQSNFQHNSSHKNNQNLNHMVSLNSFYKQNNQNQHKVYYENSERKKSFLLSHRPLGQSSSNLSSVRNQNKQNNSHKMLFSHRMQQIIQGKNQEKTIIQVKDNISSVNKKSQIAYQKNKPQNKHEFWARIQSTINQD